MNDSDIVILPDTQRRRPVVDRFFEKVRRSPGCWLWTASLDGKGYGQFQMGGSTGTVRAHRWCYEYFNGAIPAGLVIDHPCRDSRCVNPGHLEAVTFAENGRRGNAGRHRYVREFCMRDLHRLADCAHVRPNGTRYCKPCSRLAERARRTTA